MRLGRLRDIPAVELGALLLFWVLLFWIREADESAGQRGDGGGGFAPGRKARHPSAWAELTKTHVV